MDNNDRLEYAKKLDSLVGYIEKLSNALREGDDIEAAKNIAFVVDRIGIITHLFNEYSDTIRGIMLGTIRR